ncbi:hypothetical protein FIBSPDRAFT_871449 [Athelia psychrophila]|uniref:Uncharacterized protein n=1 Tax=Athelia psychrophila TaxID=1759441 RepID=A0A166A7W9_9AGAM|nr:hypothetical protein FIBSPDRAFT_871449 [Fibularhizoctonia sp. CBS 109695]
MGYTLPPSTVIATWACFTDPGPRRVPPTAHILPRPVAFRDRGPIRADAGAFHGFPHEIVDL